MNLFWEYFNYFFIYIFFLKIIIKSKNLLSKSVNLRIITYSLLLSCIIHIIYLYIERIIQVFAIKQIILFFYLC